MSTRFFLQAHAEFVSDVALAFLLLTAIFRMLIIILNLTFNRCIYERIDEK